MGIAWLWYFTNSADANHLQAQNEQRAAAAYSLWRATHRRLADLTDWLRHEMWDERRRERIGRHEFRGLSDHLLQDIGVLREGVDEYVAEPRPATRTAPLSRPTAGDAPAVGTCRQVAALPARVVPRDEAIDVRPRAA